MLRVLALPFAVLAVLAVEPSQAKVAPYRAAIAPLSAPLRPSWPAVSGGPAALSAVAAEALTVSHLGFDDRVHEGQIVVNRDVAAPLAKVFRKLYDLRFPIRHMRFADAYGPARARPADGDISGSFECRQAVPSPCTGGTASGSWSNHAYGHAIDLNPVENPYVGCGRTRDQASERYIDRSDSPGMVTPAAVRAFRSIGWGWGGDWSGRTKDYMHFSTTGH